MLTNVPATVCGRENFHSDPQTRQARCRRPALALEPSSTPRAAPALAARAGDHARRSPRLAFQSDPPAVDSHASRGPSRRACHPGPTLRNPRGPMALQVE